MQRKKTTDQISKSPVTSRFQIEADGQGSKTSLSVSNVFAVVELSEEFISLRLARGKINVRGKKLGITVYENNIVEICGRVGILEFL